MYEKPLDLFEKFIINILNNRFIQYFFFYDEMHLLQTEVKIEIFHAIISLFTFNSFSKKGSNDNSQCKIITFIN